MEKRFRHRLIMLLIYGDVMRATWYFVYAGSALARGQVGTESAFCQSSGFFIQYATETSDYAGLVIAVHSALQVFHPSTQAAFDGLYPYRIYVYAGSFIFPVLMAGLAFVNPSFGYLTVGAFCTLPLRPFWYRLALMWVPRYVIASVIIGLAIAIYTYVGFEFRKYARQSSNHNNPLLSPTSDKSIKSQQRKGQTDATIVQPEITKPSIQKSRGNSSDLDDGDIRPRRTSSVSFVEVESLPRRAISHASVASVQSPMASVMHLSTQRNAGTRPPLTIIPSGDSIRPTRSNELQFAVNPSASIGRVMAGPAFAGRDAGPFHDIELSYGSSEKSPGQRQMERQRARIHRQLQLMFIYPLVYTLMWLIPFIQHCSNYQDKYVIHPIWALRVGAVVCMTIMGFVDCLIFSLREKPWQSIASSDGTFWGSFAVFHGSGKVRHASLAESCEVSVNGTTSTGSLMRQPVAESMSVRMKNSVRMSSSSNDRAMITNSAARARLVLEKEERLATARARIFGYARDDDEDGDISEYDHDGNESLTETMAKIDLEKGKERPVGS
ncbi:G protein-coupled receptor gpr1 [Coniothyrium glycines]